VRPDKPAPVGPSSPRRSLGDASASQGRRADSGSVRHASRTAWSTLRLGGSCGAVLSHALAEPVSELTTADARVRSASPRPSAESGCLQASASSQPAFQYAAVGSSMFASRSKRSSSPVAAKVPALDEGQERRSTVQLLDDRSAVDASAGPPQTLAPVAKSLSGGDLAGLERDVVAERLELADEASGEAVGVLAGEVIAAQVAIDLAGLEHVPGGGQDRVADGGDGL
jgi:hypothetical protein